MKRLALILEGGPFLIERLPELFPGLSRLAEQSVLARLSVIEPSLVPEARWLGVAPREVGMEDGPLVLAAYGVEPPDRAWQFHLSLLGLSDGVLALAEPTALEIAAIAEALPKLNTRALTFVKGIGADHGLVYEGKMDLGTVSPSDATGQELRAVLPDGDGEHILRQFIDDAVNLLSELELNRIREKEGLVPVSVAWPWGGGFRYRTPQLALARGEVVTVRTSRLRAAGLARLCSYKADLASAEIIPSERMLGTSTAWVWEPILEDEDHLFHLSRRIDGLLDFEEMMVAVAPTEASEGLAMRYERKFDARQGIPFDARALEESRLPKFAFEEWMRDWYERASLLAPHFGSL